MKTAGKLYLTRYCQENACLTPFIRASVCSSAENDLFLRALSTALEAASQPDVALAR